MTSQSGSFGPRRVACVADDLGQPFIDGHGLRWWMPRSPAPPPAWCYNGSTSTSRGPLLVTLTPDPIFFLALPRGGRVRTCSISSSTDYSSSESRCATPRTSMSSFHSAHATSHQAIAESCLPCACISPVSVHASPYRWRGYHPLRTHRCRRRAGPSRSRKNRGLPTTRCVGPHSTLSLRTPTLPRARTRGSRAPGCLTSAARVWMQQPLLHDLRSDDAHLLEGLRIDDAHELRRDDAHLHGRPQLA